LFTIAFEDSNFYWIVENDQDHPCVINSDFTFSNSDGSTELPTLIDFKSPNAVFALLKSLSIEYLFQQKH
jgi:hypothetical protein